MLVPEHAFDSNDFRELVFHTPSLSAAKLQVELVYTPKETDKPQRLAFSVISGQSFIHHSSDASVDELKSTKGILNVPLYADQGWNASAQFQYAGDLSLKYLIVTPFQHKCNNLLSLWQGYSA